MPYLETSWLIPEGRNEHAQRKKWQKTVPRKPVFGWWVLLERVQAEAAVAHPHPSEGSMWGRAPRLSPLGADRDVERKNWLILGRVLWCLNLLSFHALFRN